MPIKPTRRRPLEVIDLTTGHEGAGRPAMAKASRYVVLDPDGPKPALVKYAGPPVSKVRTVSRDVNDLRELPDMIVLQADPDEADSPEVDSASTREPGRQEGRASIPMRSKRTVARRDALLQRAQENLARRKSRRS